MKKIIYISLISLMLLTISGIVFPRVIENHETMFVGKKGRILRACCPNSLGELVGRTTPTVQDDLKSEAIWYHFWIFR